MGRRPDTGGLFPERRKRPALVTPAPMAENGREGLRACILRLLLRSNIQAAVTDSKTVKTSSGPRQLVYPEGWPDITASIPVTGRAWGIEIKTEDGDLRPSQEDKLPELQAAGWLITLARSVEDVNEELKRQIALLDRRAFDNYLTSLRLLRSAAARRAAERESKPGRTARGRRHTSQPTFESVAPAPADGRDG